jgi:hypothetical protein
MMENEDRERRADMDAADALYVDSLERLLWEDAGDRAERLARAWDRALPEWRLDPPDERRA